MTYQHAIFRELEEYAQRVGIDPSTVCRKATGNPRLRERLERRLERMDADVDRLRAYMVANPPVSSGSGRSLACCADVDSASGPVAGSKENLTGARR